VLKVKNIDLDISPHLELFILSFSLATSQLFLPPKFDKTEDQLPVSPDGGVLDIHITAFLSAIDGLLTAGRSNAPTRVLTPMKSVVNAVTNIIEDVKIFERRPQRDRSDVNPDALRSLRDRAEATLSNLVAATKTHVLRKLEGQFVFGKPPRPNKTNSRMLLLQVLQGLRRMDSLLSLGLSKR